MTNNQIWVVFFLALWAGSLWFAYSMGYLSGGTAANIEAAKHFSRS